MRFQLWRNIAALYTISSAEGPDRGRGQRLKSAVIIVMVREGTVFEPGKPDNER